MELPQGRNDRTVLPRLVFILATNLFTFSYLNVEGKFLDLNSGEIYLHTGNLAWVIFSGFIKIQIMKGKFIGLDNM